MIRKFTLASLSALAIAAFPATGMAQDDEEEQGEDGSDVIVVQGVRAAVQAAQEIKKNSALVVDSIVAEDVGKLPDNSVAEALARVTGVQIRRDAGEANSVLIRGLPNVVTLLNGREVFTTTGRFIALGDVPSNVLQRVDVYKSNSADIIEGGIAGTIDIRTRRPFDNPGLNFDVNGRVAYNDKADTFNPNVGATVSNTWDVGEGEFGALLGLSYVGSQYHEERAFNVEFVDQAGAGGAFGAGNPPPTTPLLAPFVMGYIPIAGDRQRTAGNFALQWRPSPQTELYAEGFVTKYQDEFELNFFVGLPLLGNGQAEATVHPGTNVLKTLRNFDVFTITSTQANDNDSLTQQYSVGGSHELGNLTLSTDLSYTTSDFELRNPILDFGVIVPEVFVDTDANGTAQLDYGGSNFDIATDEGFFLENWFDNHRTDEGSAVDWRGDFDWETPDMALFNSFSGGLRYAERKAESIGGVPGGTGRPPGAMRFASEFDGLGCVSEPMADGGPDYVMYEWYTPCGDFLRDNTDQLRQAFTGTTERKPLDPGTFFDINETTTAAYLQFDAEGNLGSLPWSLVAGARYVITEEDLNGNLSQDTDNDGDLDYTPINIQTKSEELLPTANLKLFFTDDFIGRLSAGRTITRPNFGDLNPGVSLSTVVSNTTGLTGSGGNPFLEPVTSNNYDAALEWYFAPDGYISGTFFYRDFEGYVQPSVGFENFFGDEYRLTRPGNTGDGHLQGYELSYQQFYSGLPAPFDGFGLQANYTYMEGDTTNLDTGVEQSITGLSNASYNLIGLYEKGPWSARLAYNWRDEFLDVRNIAAGYDLYVDVTKQLDGQISYRLNENMIFTLEGVNLLDTEFKDYFSDPNNPDLNGYFPRDTRRYDRSILLGVRFSL